MMKKSIVFIVLIFFMIITFILVKVSDNNIKNNKILSYNAEFEKYYNKNFLGTDVLTLINKALDNNEKNYINKDENGFYIEDNEYSLIIEIIFITTDKDGQTDEKTTRMETLENAGLQKFISNFGLTTFQCTNIEYNSQNRVKKMTLKQIEL